jgi:hypothetical protein
MSASLETTVDHPFSPNRRYFVPDLSPLDRRLLKSAEVEHVFIAESPHISEIEAEAEELRRPLCGMAGRQWWTMLAEVLGENEEVTLTAESLQLFCRKYRLAVLNAVQYPLDPKVTKRFQEADPVKNLGFQKASGPYSFKRLRGTEPVQTAIRLLEQRVRHPSLSQAKIHCLGNDAQWFLGHALAPYPEDFQRYVEKIPHPSAWWRQGGFFGRVAHEKLSKIFQSRQN